MGMMIVQLDTTLRVVDTDRVADTDTMDAVDVFGVDMDAVFEVDDPAEEVVETDRSGSPATLVVRPATSLVTARN